MSSADDRQPAQQVLAHAAVLHRGVESGIDAGHRPHVERGGLAGLREDRLAIAKQPCEPALHTRRRLGDVLQVDRAAACGVKAALTADPLEAFRSIAVLPARRRPDSSASSSSPSHAAQSTDTNAAAGCCSV